MIGRFSANLTSFLAGHLDLPLSLASELCSGCLHGGAAHKNPSPLFLPHLNIHPASGHCHNNGCNSRHSPGGVFASLHPSMNEAGFECEPATNLLIGKIYAGFTS